MGQHKQRAPGILPAGTVQALSQLAKYAIDAPVDCDECRPRPTCRQVHARRID